MRAAFTLIILCLCLGIVGPVFAQQQEWVTEALSKDGSFSYDFKNGMAMCTNGALVKYGNAVLVADTVLVNMNSGETFADGRVRIQSDAMVWVGEHIRYNFKTHKLEAENFRAGKAPFFAAGEGLRGDLTNKVYTSTNGFITLDDYSDPTLKVRAKRLVIRPGQSLEAYGATLCVGGVPVFYLPYYKQSLDATASAFTFTPGYRNRYGAFILGSYAWKVSEAVDTRLHVDYRTERGVGVGPDVLLHFGKWGEVFASYYYLDDMNPELALDGLPYPHNRQMVKFNWLASPYTNTTFKSRVSFASDSGVQKEFDELAYRRNPEPTTFIEGRRFWDNFSLDVVAQPRVNDFFETVERLPEVKLTGFRQQIGATPLYYESVSSVGYYRHLFAETNELAAPFYEAARADTWNQIVLPETLFGWLNVIPRAGGRFTYYSQSEGPGAIWNEEQRGVFNTGAEVSFKTSRLWAGARNGLFDVDGLRHIFQPSANYVYVPSPNVLTNQLPRFDATQPSLLLLPIDYPDFNAIDSVDSQNVVRWGMLNRLQTKRDGQVVDLLAWEMYTDWRLTPEPGQTTFSDLWSDFQLTPRSWLKLESLTRFSIDTGQWQMAFNSVTLQPNSTWSWRVGHFYLRDNYSTTDPAAWGIGHNLATSTIYYRFNENWGVMASHYFNIQERKFQQQIYSLYRDFRSWTGALSFRAREDNNGENDYTIVFTFSIKAMPRFGLGHDTVHTESLLGD